MILKRGITGFFKRDDREPIPEFPFTEFKRVVYGLADPLQLTVTQIEPRRLTPNFHTAWLRGSEAPLMIVGHATYPIFAFSEPRSQNECQLRFIDCPQIATELIRILPDAVIASTEELNRQPTESDLARLDTEELTQIRYWQPKTIGEIAFNWWD